MTRLIILAALAFAATLVAACSDAEPSPTPIGAAAVVDRVIEAMNGVSFTVQSRSEWHVLNRATGEWRDGAENHTTSYSSDGSFLDVLVFPHLLDSSDRRPERRETRCVDGRTYLWYESSGWATPIAGRDGCPSGGQLIARYQSDISWTEGPHLVEVTDGTVLRLEGERLWVEERDGKPDPSSYSLMTLRIEVDPDTYRLVEIEEITRGYVGADAWGINPDPREPVNTLATVTTFSNYGEAVVVVAPEGVE